MKTNKLKTPAQMTKKELIKWIKWADEEIKEYFNFVQPLLKELKKRK